MNQLLDLINRYAAPAGYRVNPREWLMLLELDPDTAARTINHLAILDRRRRRPAHRRPRTGRPRRRPQPEHRRRRQ